LGTKAFQALTRINKKHGASTGICDVQSAGCYYITFHCEKSRETIVSFIRSLKDRISEQDSLIGQGELVASDKFDHCIPAVLANKAYEKNALSPGEALDSLYRMR